VFARPAGVEGSFAPRPAGPDGEKSGTGLRLAPPPPEALRQAFSRPPGSSESLQRPPGDTPREPQPDPEPPLWSEREEERGWRDPGAPAVLGPPALDEEQEQDAEQVEGARLSLRELLFGRRVQPSALVVLLVAALLVGAVGGLVGRLTAEGGNPLTDPDVTLAQVAPAEDRPAGSISDVANRVLPAVVSIEVTLGDGGGTGSGVVIDGAGYVLTNNHVISIAAKEQRAKITVVFNDGTRAEGRIVGRDPKSDLAVLKVEVANPTVIQLGRSSDLRVGDRVIAIGSPLRLAGTVTEGIVSALNRPVRLEPDATTDTNAVINAIQTDAAINHGNSGGALVDGRGALVGINTAIRSSGPDGGSIGLGFAIPIDDAKRIAEQLIRTGEVKHPELGVNARTVMDGTGDGAQVQNVQDGSAAAEAGIVEGDVIIKVGDRKVTSADELIVAVRSHQIGERVPVQLVREGRQLTLEVTLKSD